MYREQAENHTQHNAQYLIVIYLYMWVHETNTTYLSPYRKLRNRRHARLEKMPTQGHEVSYIFHNS